ncbi:MAG: tRNA-dihydrouridine synthase [bacterium]
MKIGSYELPTDLMLAPMSGVSDLPFRLIARRHGAKFCFFEMIDCNGLIHNAKRNLDILATTEEDQPTAAQLVGADPDDMLKAAKVILSNVKIPFLDINAACPVKKVLKKKAGSYLLKDVKRLSAIIKKLAAGLPIPVTVKLRTGFLKADLKEIASIAKQCEKSGAAAIFIHGRTQRQGYSGEIDYKSIKAVKEAVTIPVFGSGNVFSTAGIKKMFNETGCDGVMVARGSFGNPWIFQGVDQVDLATRQQVLKAHLALVNEYRQVSKIGFLRKVALWYLKSFPDASKVRGQVNGIQSYEELLALVDCLI